MALYLLVLPGKAWTWETLGAPNASPRLEHEVIREWASEFSGSAVIISRTPYLWENFDAYTASPEQADHFLAGAVRDRFIHYGLFDQTNGLRPERELLLKSVTTEHGEVALYRLP